MNGKRYLGSIDGPPGTLSYLAVSAQGERIADVGDRYVRVTKAPQGSSERSSEPSNVPVYGLAVNHSGQQIAVARENRQLELWDGRVGRTTTTLKDKLGGKTDAVDFSPDGRFVAWLSESGEANIWSLIDDKVVARIPGAHGEPMGLRYSDGGQTLVATTQKGSGSSIPKQAVRLNKRWAHSRQVSLAMLGTQHAAVIMGTADSNTGAVELWDLKRGVHSDHR